MTTLHRSGRRRLGSVLLTTGALLLTVAAGTASASVTGTLGENPFDQPLTTASTSCPSGTWITAVQVGTEFSGVVDALSITCSDGSSGSGQLGSGTPDVGSSDCPDGTTADGIHGRAGYALDQVGLRCGGTDATPVGGGGGDPAGPFDCAAGEALVGLQAGLGDYFGRPTLFTLTGLCAPQRAVTTAQCKQGGWQDYGDRYKNQGDCVSDVVRESNGSA